MSLTPTQRKQIADLAGISEQYLYQCLTGRRDMRPAEAVRLEALSKGLVKREQLRRDADAVWPKKKPAVIKPSRKALEEVAEG